MTVKEVIHCLSKFDPNMKVVVNFTDTTDWTDQFDLTPNDFIVEERWCDGMGDDVDGNEKCVIIPLGYNQAQLITYIYVAPKIKNMNITERRKQVVKRFCEMIENDFPEYDIDEGEGGSLTLTPSWSKRPGDDSIDFHRSRFDLCSLGWASIQTMKDEAEMEKKLDVILKELEF